MVIKKLINIKTKGKEELGRKKREHESFMILRNEKKIIHRIFNRRKTKKFIDNFAVMATTTIINARSGVTPFCGRENGELKQSVENFITSVESLIVTKGLKDKQFILNEAKSYLDFSKGDLSHWARTISFRNCNDWETLRCFLRKVYGGYSDIGLVRDMGSILRHVDRGGFSMVANGAKINDRMLEFIAKIKNSDWVSDDTITLDNFAVLIQLGLVMASLPEPLVNCFDKPLTKDSSETDIMDQVVKHKGKIADFDVSILDGKESMGKTKKKENVQEIGVVNITENTSRSSVNARGNVTCHNCGRKGHVIRDCYARFCSTHNTVNHSYMNCWGRSGRSAYNTDGINKSTSIGNGRWQKGNSYGRGSGYNRNGNNSANGRNNSLGRNYSYSPNNTYAGRNDKNESHYRGRSQTPSPNVNKANFQGEGRAANSM